MPVVSNPPSEVSVLAHTRLVFATQSLLLFCSAFVAPVTAEPPATEPDRVEQKRLELKEKRLENKHEKEMARIQRRIDGVGATVVFDNVRGTQSRNRIELQEDEVVVFRIVNTNSECYSFNLKEITEPSKRIQTDVALPHNESVEITTIHDDTTAAYEITVTRHTNFTQKECPHEQSWRVAVRQTGWELGFAGAYTADKLTDPSFALRPGTGSHEGTSKIVVEDKEDAWKTGPAAMIHLFHSGAFRIGKGVSWAPMSFGLNADSDQPAKYYFGTGLKFGKQAFLTAGVAIGSRDELPPGLNVGDYTTLTNLPLESRTDSAFFAGISFSFINASISNRFEKAFEVKKPAPSSEEPEPTGESNAKKLQGKFATATNFTVQLSRTAEKYEITEVSHQKPEGGDAEVESITVTYKRGDGVAPTAEDDAKVKEQLGMLNPGTTFEVKRQP